MVNAMRIKIFADCADLGTIDRLAAHPDVKGFTTNPTLMRKAGVTDYKAFALEVLRLAGERPVSFEVFADNFSGMYNQAREIASWGDNVYVKIPITDTKGDLCGPLMTQLSGAGVKLNVTAVMTIHQVRRAWANLRGPAIISVFAGRIADTGRHPSNMMASARAAIDGSKVELLWASAREVLNVYQAEEIGCDIITLSPDLIDKLELKGKALDEYSRETVEMFHRDAAAARYTIPITKRGAA